MSCFVAFWKVGQLRADKKSATTRVMMDVQLERVYRTSAFERNTQGIRITYYSLMFFIAYAFNGHVHVFAGRVKVVSHSSCRTSAIFKYFCPLGNIVIKKIQQ